MLSLDQILLFSAASLVLAFTPGPDIIYVLTRGVAQGRTAALAAAAGFSLGNIVHTLAAALGLSALIMSSSWAFQIIKLCGAAYLVWIGFQILRSSPLDMSQTSTSGKRDLKAPAVIFRQSVIANVLNPKVAVFFLAFFPQFIVEGNGPVSMQMALLGLNFILVAFASFSFVALASGSLHAWLSSRPGFSRRINAVAGSVLIGLGLRLAWPEKM
jgi:threonine/homoserine/homoserine lactone efflux protein